MDELIRRSDAIEAIKDNSFALGDDYMEINGYGAIDDIRALPSVDRPRGEWIDKAISIIDDMQREGIVDYQQAWEFRMRARMKGADDETTND